MPGRVACSDHAGHAGLGEPYEIILVDDNSQDSSPERIPRIALRDELVRGVILSRNFGQAAAILQVWILQRGCGHHPGLRFARSPESIPKLILAWKNGAEVAYGIHTNVKGKTG